MEGVKTLLQLREVLEREPFAHLDLSALLPGFEEGEVPTKDWQTELGLPEAAAVKRPPDGQPEGEPDRKRARGSDGKVEAKVEVEEEEDECEDREEFLAGDGECDDDDDDESEEEDVEMGDDGERREYYESPRIRRFNKPAGFVLLEIVSILRATQRATLRTLNLSGARTCQASLSALFAPDSLPLLEEVTLSQCSFLNWFSSLHVTNMTMRRLDISEFMLNDFVENAQLRTCNAAAMVAAMPNLESLIVLKEMVGLANAFAERVAELKNLQVFRVSVFEEGFDRGRLQFTDKGLTALAKGCPHLRELDVDHAVSLRGGCLESLLAHCTELQRLSLAVTGQYHDGLEVFTSRMVEKAHFKWSSSPCPSLTSLRLLMTQMDDTFLSARVAGCMPALQEMVFAPCLATPRGIETVLATTPSVRLLGLGVAQLDAAAVSSIAARCPALERLLVYRYERPHGADPMLTTFTPENVEQLRASCPRLEELHIVRQVLSSELLQALGRLPLLKILHVSDCDISKENFAMFRTDGRDPAAFPSLVLLSAFGGSFRTMLTGAKRRKQVAEGLHAHAAQWVGSAMSRVLLAEEIHTLLGNLAALDVEDPMERMLGMQEVDEEDIAAVNKELAAVQAAGDAPQPWEAGHDDSDAEGDGDWQRLHDFNRHCRLLKRRAVHTPKAGALINTVQWDALKVAQLCRAMQGSPVVTTVQLFCAPLQEEREWAPLAAALASLPSLTEVSLVTSSLPPEGHALLAHSLSGLPNLRVVDLPRNNPGDLGLRALSILIRTAPRLEKIAAGGFQGLIDTMTEETWAAFADALASTRRDDTLPPLNVSFENIYCSNDVLRPFTVSPERFAATRTTKFMAQRPHNSQPLPENPEAFWALIHAMDAAQGNLQLPGFPPYVAMRQDDFILPDFLTVALALRKSGWTETMTLPNQGERDDPLADAIMAYRCTGGTDEAVEVFRKGHAARTAARKAFDNPMQGNPYSAPAGFVPPENAAAVLDYVKVKSEKPCSLGTTKTIQRQWTIPGQTALITACGAEESTHWIIIRTWGANPSDYSARPGCILELAPDASGNLSPRRVAMLTPQQHPLCLFVSGATEEDTGLAQMGYCTWDAEGSVMLLGLLARVPGSELLEYSLAEPIYRLTGPRDVSHVMVYGPAVIAGGGEINREIYEWDLQSGERRYAVRPAKPQLAAMQWRGDGIVVAGCGGSAFVLNRDTQTVSKGLSCKNDGDMDPPFVSAVDYDDRVIITTTFHTLMVWDRNTLSRLHVVALSMRSFAYAPHGRAVISHMRKRQGKQQRWQGTGQGVVTIYDTAAWTPVCDAPVDEESGAAAAVDSSRLITLGPGAITLFECGSGGFRGSGDAAELAQAAADAGRKELLSGQIAVAMKKKKTAFKDLEGIIEGLRGEGASANLVRWTTTLALFKAIEYSDEKVALAILARPDWTIDFTQEHAVLSPMTPMIMFSRNEDTNLPDSFKNSLVGIAVFLSQISVVKALVEAGHPVDGFTLLVMYNSSGLMFSMMDFQKGSDKIKKTFVETTNAVLDRADLSTTPQGVLSEIFRLMCHNQHFDLLGRFLSAVGRPTYSMLVQVAHQNSAEMVRKLIEAGAPVDPPEGEREELSIVHTACRDQRTDVLRALIAGGADPDIKTGKNPGPKISPIMTTSSLEIYRILLEEYPGRVDVNWYPLRLDPCPVLHNLLGHQGSIQPEDSPIMLKMLLANGADVRVRNRHGKDAVGVLQEAFETFDKRRQTEPGNAPFFTRLVATMTEERAILEAHVAGTSV